MSKNTENGARLGFENDLWRAADALRSNMDAAEYKYKMNLAIRGIDSNHRRQDAGSFHRDLHPVRSGSKAMRDDRAPPLRLVLQRWDR